MTHKKDGFGHYPWRSSRSWGSSSWSLKVSILSEIDSIECIETFIWVCKSLIVALVLSTAEELSPFTSWFLRAKHFFSYAILTRSPDCHNILSQSPTDRERESEGFAVYYLNFIIEFLLPRVKSVQCWLMATRKHTRLFWKLTAAAFGGDQESWWGGRRSWWEQRYWIQHFHGCNRGKIQNNILFVYKCSKNQSKRWKILFRHSKNRLRHSSKQSSSIKSLNTA